MSASHGQYCVRVRAQQEDGRVRIVVERIRPNSSDHQAAGVMVADRYFPQDDVAEMKMTDDDLRDLGLIVIAELSGAMKNR